MKAPHLAWLALLLLSICEGVLAQPPVAISIDSSASGVPISTDFIGLSYEMALLDPAANGARYFSPTNSALISTFRALGVKSLRVGGNTADRATVKEADTEDIDQLFAFAEKAGVKVIYTLRLNGSDPAHSAKIAKYILDHYRPFVSAFAIGNEPDKQFATYAEFRDAFGHRVQTILRSAPGALFCGPCAMQKNVDWSRNFAADFAHDPNVVYITQHEYPAASGRVVNNPIAGCQKLLSPEISKVCERFHDLFVPAVNENHKHYRIEEANSFSNGGAASVSDAFASALWAIDYMYWWAEHGADGINFHTGGFAGDREPPRHMNYVAFWNAPGGFTPHPLAYAMKLFDLGSHGLIIPVSIEDNDGRLNVVCHAVRGPDQDLFVTLINKEISGRDALVTLKAAQPIERAQALCLRAAGGVTEKTNIWLGGAPIANDGQWSGVWSRQSCENGRVAIKLPTASALVLRLSTAPEKHVAR